MDKPRISVVIPAYNEERYLPHCLASLQKQTHPPLEVIVVDNNSTDKTAEIAKSLGAKVVFEKKQGIAHARDAGFKAVKGEIIARTDADSQVPPDWLEKIIEFFEKSPQAVALTGVTTFNDACPVVNFLSRYHFTAYLYFFKIFAGHHQFNGPNLAIKKEVLAKISPFSDDPLLHEDMDLACHIAAHGKIIFCPSLTIYSSARRFQKNPFGAFIRSTRMWLHAVSVHGHPFVRNHHS